MNSKNIPNTLKFILQLTIALFLLIMITSVASLILTMANFTNVTKSIEICDHTLTRLNDLSAIRILLKYVTNIANGYISANSSLIGDKFDYYVQVIDDSLVEMKNNEIYVQEQGLNNLG